jgi:hypothetical protein
VLPALILIVAAYVATRTVELLSLATTHRLVRALAVATLLITAYGICVTLDAALRSNGVAKETLRQIGGDTRESESGAGSAASDPRGEDARRLRAAQGDLRNSAIAQEACYEAKGTYCGREILATAPYNYAPEASEIVGIAGEPGGYSVQVRVRLSSGGTRDCFFFVGSGPAAHTYRGTATVEGVPHCGP